MPNAPEATAGPFSHQFHQIAMYFPNGLGQLHLALKTYQDMGYDQWEEDTAVLRGTLFGQEVTTRGHMWFNYQAQPMELELLWYDGPSRHHKLGSAYISHMSTYVEPETLDWHIVHLSRKHGLYPFHRFVTEQHTNPNVVGKKRFREAIYSTHPQLGYDIKLIERVPWDYDGPTP